jgi:hypothetical protein
MSEQQRLEDDTAPDAGASVEQAPVKSPPPAGGDDDLPALLDQFDRETAKPAAEPEPAPEQPVEPDQLDQWIADYDRQQAEAERQRLREAADPMLRVENEQARAAVENARQAYEYEAWRIGEQKAFIEECGRIQEKLPDWVPDGFVQDTLRVMALDDPSLEVAFQARNVNPVAAHVEYDKAIARLAQLKLNPIANPQEIAAMEQQAYHWRIAIHAKQILASAEESVIKKARARPPIDPVATADRAMVAQAVRGASDPHPVEPQIDWGRLSPQEFDAEKRKLGFV